MEWTSVNDRLPEEEGWYLVCINGWVTEAWWMITGWTDFMSCNASSNMVHHWMPKPKPPKEEL